MRAVVVTEDASTVQMDGRPLFQGSLEDLVVRIPAMRRDLDRPFLIVTPNVDHVLDARLSPVAQKNFSEADLVVVDGMPVMRLLRRLGAHRVERITGADLARELCFRSGELGLRVAIVGGKGDIAAQAAAQIQRSAQDPQVRGFAFPFVTDVSDAAVRDVVRALAEWRPDVALICLGAPKQESFVVQHGAELPPAVYIGCGAAVDFLAGTVRRAPRFVQQLGLEWLFRVAQEPRRLFRRYFVKGPRFLAVVASSVRGSRTSSRTGGNS